MWTKFSSLIGLQSASLSAETSFAPDQGMMPSVQDHFVAPAPLLLLQGHDGGVIVDVIRIREFKSGVMHARVPISLLLPACVNSAGSPAESSAGRSGPKVF